MTKRHSPWQAILLIIGLLLAGCSDGGEGTETAASSEDAAAASSESGTTSEPSGGGELTPITVGILPIADLAPLYHAIDQGYFADEGLDVSMEVGQGGAALVPAVVAGEYQFAFGNYVSLMLARQNNVGVRIVQNVVDGAADADRGTNALLAGPDSGVAGVEDLAGKRFAVTTLNNLAEVTIRSTLRNADVDDSGIDFIELPFPEMNAAAEAGDVDVAWQAEPFVTLGEQAELTNVVDPMFATIPAMPIAGMFASDQWLEENADTASAFVRALQRGLEDGTDEEAMRTAIVDNTETPEELAAEIALANWNPDLDTDKLAETGRLAADYGVLDVEPDMAELVWQQE